MGYLDRTFLKKQGGKSLIQQALESYKNKVFKNNFEKLRLSILDEIRKDRDDEQIDQILIKKSIQQFIYMGYEQNIEIKKIEEF